MDVSMLISFRTTRIRSLIVKTCVSKKKMEYRSTSEYLIFKLFCVYVFIEIVSYRRDDWKYSKGIV